MCDGFLGDSTANQTGLGRCWSENGPGLGQQRTAGWWGGCMQTNSNIIMIEQLMTIIKYWQWCTHHCRSSVMLFSLLFFLFLSTFCFVLGFPDGLAGKESVCHARDSRNVGSIPGSRRSSGAGNSNPLQYSCLENPMVRGAWWATVHRVAKESDMTEHTHK